MLTILLDVDGPCAKLVEYAIEYINNNFREPEDDLEEKDVWTWDFLDPENSILTKEESDDLQYHFKTSRASRFFLPCMDAVRTVEKMRDLGHRVVFVTSPFPGADSWPGDRIKWLKMHFDAQDRDIIFAHDKYLVSGDIFIDDNIRNVVLWSHANPNGDSYLMDHHWNRSFKPERYNQFKLLDIKHLEDIVYAKCGDPTVH